MNVLVTGGNGLVGIPTVRRLCTDGQSVTVMSRTGSIESIEGSTLIQGDITSEDGVGKAFRHARPDAVIHLAALIDVRDSFARREEYEKVNVEGTAMIASACREFGVPRLVFASSCAVYGEPQRLPVVEDAPLSPQSPYAEQKVQAEKIVREVGSNGIEAVILRYGNVFGSPAGGGVIPKFFANARDGISPQVYGDGLQARDFVHSNDVAAANVAALSGEPGTYNIASGRATSILELITRLKESGEPLLEPEFVAKGPTGVKRMQLDISRAKRLLDWTPAIGLAQGIRLMREMLPPANPRGF